MQEDPPAFGLVTADRVADWLEERTLQAVARIPELPGREYADETFPDFRLTDFLNGTVTLQGGFDATPVDGPGLHFDVTAVVPEPGMLALAAVALAAAFGLIAARRLRSPRRRHA